jgi:RNA polymerase sigma-70 factor (ECF subfamily)
MISGPELQHLLGDSRTNQEAAGSLLEAYRPVLQLLADQMVGPGLRRREGSSDVVQRTVIEAYAAFESFKGHSEPEFSAWIKRILSHNVTNLIRDHRAAKRDVRREQYFDAADESITLTWLQPAAKISSASQRAIKAEAAINLAAAIEKLPEEQQIAVRMRHLEGCSLEELAATLNKSDAAVAGLLRRGLQALRKQLGEDG